MAKGCRHNPIKNSTGGLYCNLCGQVLYAPPKADLHMNSTTEPTSVIVKMSDYASLQNPGKPAGPREPDAVWYDLAVCHHPNGSIETWVKGLADHPHSKFSIAAALRQAADGIDET